jgi:hypothetical protein
MPRQTLDIEYVSEIELIKYVKVELGRKHPVMKGELVLFGDTLKRAVTRWADSKGYGAAITSGEMNHNRLFRVICFFKDAVDVREATLSELKQYHGENINTAASRWVSSNKTYTTGWLNGEEIEGRLRIICLKNMKNKYGDVLFKYNNVKRSEIDSSPDAECNDRIMRWAKDRDYLAGMPNNEADAEYIGVVCALYIGN